MIDMKLNVMKASTNHLLLLFLLKEPGVCMCFRASVGEDDSSWRLSVCWEEEEETRPETVKTRYLTFTNSH